MAKKIDFKPIKRDSLKFPSEWAGYYRDANGETEPLGAKGLHLEGMNDGLFKYFIAAITYLYESDKDKDISKNIKFIEGKIDNEHANFTYLMWIVLFLELKELYTKITEESYFFYQSETKNIVNIKGRIDFVKSVQVNQGLIHKHVCTYRKISFDHELLSLMKEFFIHFTDKINNSKKFPLLASELEAMTSHVSHMFSEARPLKSYIDECVKVCSLKYDHDHRFIKIMSHVKYLAHFYLDNNLFFSNLKNKNLPPMDGFVFNLNRPFELILQRSMGLLYGEAKNNKNFTHARYIHDEKAEAVEEKFIGRKNTDNIFVPTRSTWLTDCWFQIGERTVILDAKHKVLSRDFIKPKDIKKSESVEYASRRDDEDDKDGEDDGVGNYLVTKKASTKEPDSKKEENEIYSMKVDRNDLFQLSTYMMLHPKRDYRHNKEEDNIYGLVALHEEKNFKDKIGEYVINEKPNVVQFFFDGEDGKDHPVADEYKIKIVTVRFSQFLLDLGFSINAEGIYSSQLDDEQKNYEGIFKEFGRQIAEKLEIPFEKISENEETLISEINKLLLDRVENKKYLTLREIEKDFLSIGCLLNINSNDEFLTLIKGLISKNYFPINIESWKERGLYEESLQRITSILKKHIIVLRKTEELKAA